MNTITTVKRFLAQSPEEVLRNFRSSFVMIDHGERVSEIEARIESIKRIYDPKTNKLDKGFVNDFSRTILTLWKEFYTARGMTYDTNLSQTTSRFMLSADTDAYSTCNTVHNNVQSNIASYTNSNNGYAANVVDAAKRFMNYYNGTGVPHIVTYNSYLSKIATLDDDFLYQDAFKNYNMQRYVREIDSLSIKQCFGNNSIERSRRYEYIMMITINEIAELCKFWARGVKNEMNCSNEDIVKTIYALGQCYYNNSDQATSFGKQFTQFFKLDGSRTSNSDTNMICHIIVIAYDQKENKFIFKYVN